VKLLLDQDFPLALCRALRGAGMEVEHVTSIPGRRPPERLFEILPWGELVAWEIVELGRQLRRLV
jgi:hypothetical protein